MNVRILEHVKSCGIPLLAKRLIRLGYYRAPASRCHHLAVESGLAVHSANVTDWLLKIGPAFGCIWTRPESPYIVGMLHDLATLEKYFDLQRLFGGFTPETLPTRNIGTYCAVEKMWCHTKLEAAT